MSIFVSYDRATINRWARYYYLNDIIVRGCLKANADVALDGAVLQHADASDLPTRQEFDALIKRLGLLGSSGHFLKAGLDEELMGEACTCWPWNDQTKSWEAGFLLNPDALDVGWQLAPGLKPARQFAFELPRTSFDNVATLGGQILLRSEEITYVARQTTPSDLRGTSRCAPVLHLLATRDEILQNSTREEMFQNSMKRSLAELDQLEEQIASELLGIGHSPWDDVNRDLEAKRERFAREYRNKLLVPFATANEIALELTPTIGWPKALGLVHDVDAQKAYAHRIWKTTSLSPNAIRRILGLSLEPTQDWFDLPWP